MKQLKTWVNLIKIMLCERNQMQEYIKLKTVSKTKIQECTPSSKTKSRERKPLP